VQAQAAAEVRALQARIHPHFLFNSMNTIASLVRSDPETAERAVEDLSDLFRAALGAGKGESTLGEELTLTERYLSIESLRLGDRLQVGWQLPADLPRGLTMPHLILQPLVENAVNHGVARLTAGGRVEIDARVERGRLLLRITNPCPRELEDQPGNRHAQSSIAQRLEHRFEGRARMTTTRGEGYYAVELELPL
jgi:two-component system sensor histidine kinase AlgZ